MTKVLILLAVGLVAAITVLVIMGTSDPTPIKKVVVSGILIIGAVFAIAGVIFGVEAIVGKSHG